MPRVCRASWEREELKAEGYVFTSDTDTEVIPHMLDRELKKGGSLVEAMLAVRQLLDGAYGTVAIDSRDPSVMVVARSGSPLVVGMGIGENFIASDQLALLPVTRRFMFLEEGDSGAWAGFKALMQNPTFGAETVVSSMVGAVGTIFDSEEAAVNEL